MQVFFDGELSYDQSDVTLQDAALEYSFLFESDRTLN